MQKVSATRVSRATAYVLFEQSMKRINIKAMRPKLSQIVILLFFVLLFLETIFPALPGQAVWFVLLTVMAILPLIVGPAQYRIAGIILLCLALFLMYDSFKAGKLYQEKRQERLRGIMMDKDINR